MTVGARNGVISLTMGLATGARATAVFAVTDEVGGSLRFTLSVRVLEAGVYGAGEQLYLFGGRFESDSFGRFRLFEWCVAVFRWGTMGAAARCRGRVPGVSRHQMVSFRGSLWVFGGQIRGSFGGVWRSADGIRWVLVTIAENLRRHSHQVVSHGGSLWLAGGMEGIKELHGDVWRSADGVSWVSVSVSGGEFCGAWGISWFLMTGGFGWRGNR